MASVSVAEQVYLAWEAGLPRVAKFLGIAEQQIINEMVTLAARASDVLRYLRGEKVRLLGNSLRRS